MPTKDSQEFYLGNIRDDMRGLLKLRYPIEHGSIKSNQDWQDMESIFKYSFNELKANPKEVKNKIFKNIHFNNIIFIFSIPYY